MSDKSRTKRSPSLADIKRPPDIPPQSASRYSSLSQKFGNFLPGSQVTTSQNSVAWGGGGGVGGAPTVSGTAENTWLNRAIVPGISKVPLITFTATIISLCIYTIIVSILSTIDCPWERNQVGHFVAFCIYAMLSSVAMLLINCYQTHYRHNCLSLTVSFLYSGSATLVLYIVISCMFNGLCQPSADKTPSGSIFTSGHAVNWIVWLLGAAAVGFQVVAHYYYG